MERVKLNENWMVSSGNADMMSALGRGGAAARQVNLPYDAMIHETRDPQCKSGNQTGFYPGNVYTYIKQLDVPAQWEGKTVILEFEGVYMNARVYVNGDFAGGHPHGYSNFYVSIADFLRYGQTNEIKVVANNPDQTSRWYPGGGIYRNVNLMVGGPVHLKTDSLKITTPDIEDGFAAVVVRATVANKGTARKSVTVHTRIYDPENTLVGESSTPITSFAGGEETFEQRINVEEPRLWDCDHPNLYRCTVTLMEGEETLDTDGADFGIRKLSLSAQHGLRVNGKEVKLRGTCIHHDNGILGAATLERAEERRCRQLKEAGFNCIRSAHHPMSKAMLNACDRIGMYVMDELSDMWTRPKNPNDYSQLFPYFWEKDVELLVDKDYNHPCAIMYSMGNEIPELGTPKGAQRNRAIHNKLKSLDSTRYTTNAINGLLAGIPRMGEIMQEILPPEMLAQAGAARDKKGDDKQQGGADALNSMMGMLFGPLADKMATSRVLSEMLDETASGMDITGYNYLTALHEAEKERHPNRVVLGSETFPADIVRLWDVVEKNSHVIGDMTWTGYDYLGEAGCGIFHYDGTPNFTSHWPDRLAYIGDLDILGYRRPISYLREIVFGLRNDPYIAVLRMDRNGQKSPSTPWMWKDNIASWTWPGYEGQTASVDVYARADEVELFLNDRSLGRKSCDGFVATYDVAYEPGVLKAVSYTGGERTGEQILETADMKVELDVCPDRTELCADGADLCFLTVGLKDTQGRWNLHAQKKVTVSVEGAGTLQGYGSADPASEESYDDTTWPTYDGFVMAAVRAGTEAGEIRVTFTAEDCQPQTVTITVH